MLAVTFVTLFRYPPHEGGEGGRVGVEWVAANLEMAVDGVDFRHVVDFTIVWSFFERRVVAAYYEQNESLSAFKLKNLIEERRGAAYGNQYLCDAFDHFMRRYTGDDGHARFDGLGAHTRNERLLKDFVWECFVRGDNSDINRAKCVAFVCCRVRNNLFHGVKDLGAIREQREFLQHAMRGIQGLALAFEVAR